MNEVAQEVNYFRLFEFKAKNPFLVCVCVDRFKSRIRSREKRREDKTKSAFFAQLFLFDLRSASTLKTTITPIHVYNVLLLISSQ